MSCRRASEIDPAEFLLEPRSSAFDDFRAHYPLCDACSRAVAAWNRVEVGLLALGESAHPDPEQLAQYHAARSGEPMLKAADRARLDEHLAGCASCRDELRALRGFSPAVLDAAAETPEPRQPDPSPAPGQRPWWRRLAWSPALALGLLAVFLLPFLGRTPDEVTSGVPEILSRQDRVSPSREAFEREGARLGEDLEAGAASRAAPPAVSPEVSPEASPPVAEPSGLAGAKEERIARAPELQADSLAQAPAEPTHRSEPAAAALPAPAPEAYASAPATAGRARSAAPAATPTSQTSKAAPADDGAAEEDAVPGSFQAPPLALASASSTLGLEEARAVTAFRVALPSDWGQSGARVVLEPEAGAKRGQAKALRDEDAPSSANLEAFAQGTRRIERRLNLGEAAEAARNVPIEGDGFGKPGFYRVEIRSLDQPERAPLVYRVEVR